MTVGTSTGEQYEDPFDHAIAMYQKKVGMADPLTEEETTPMKKTEGATQLGPQVPPDKPTTMRDVLSGKTMPGSIHEAMSNFWTNLGDAVKINRDYKVPYISGPSNDGSTVYIDKSVPVTAEIDGVKFDTSEPLKIHETVEQQALKHYQEQGMSDQAAYKKAHEDHAELAENKWYIEHGINPKSADKFWSKIDQHTEEEGTEDHPKDLFKAPYPHHKVEGSPGQGIDDPQRMSDAANDPSLNKVVPLTQAMAPKGIKTEEMRPSENVSGPEGILSYPHKTLEELRNMSLEELEKYHKLQRDYLDYMNRTTDRITRKPPVEPTFESGSLSEQAGARDYRYQQGIKKLKERMK